MKCRRALIKGTNWALAGLLGLLGFNISCGNEGEGTVEYGTPHADYSIKGSVNDEAGNAIKDIKIVIENKGETYNPKDSTTTDANGNFSWNSTDFPLQTNTYEVVASDIDGDGNGGTFASDTTTVTFQHDELKDGNRSWYQGKAEKTISIKLKKKTDE